MRPAEEGLLLLCCALGTQDVPLTPAQYRTLARRVRQTCQAGDGEVTPAYLRALGYPEAAAVQITALLDRTDTLHRYLEAAAAQDINYLDFVEISSAIDALGGERPAEREFAGDPYYESLKRV